MNFNLQIRTQLLSQIKSSSFDDLSVLNGALRFLCKWRSTLICNTLLQRQGTIIMGGPFKDMDFLTHSAEGCHVSKLLGCYEQPLLPHIEIAILTNYQTVINIGCAEGYYAVGMAIRMPHSQILAFDSNPKAQQICSMLAHKNHVSERI